MYSHITESFILLDGFQLPITEEWFPVSLRPKEIRNWPKPNEDYLKWLDKVADQWGEEWKTWDIYDVIMLSKMSFSSNIEMFLTFLVFWKSAINTFVFPFGIMSPTLFDVATMLGLPIIGEDIPPFYDKDFEDLGCLISKENATYGKYMKEHKQKQGVVGKAEHNAFLFYWLCKFYICSKSLTMVNEFSYYVSVITSGKLMNVGALFPSSFYEGLNLWIGQLKANQNKPIAGLMWFLFLWINEYFLELYCDCGLPTHLIQDSSTYSLRYKTIPVSSFSAFQIANWLFNMQPRVYLEICPFMHHSYRSN